MIHEIQEQENLTISFWSSNPREKEEFVMGMVRKKGNSTHKISINMIQAWIQSFNDEKMISHPHGFSCFG